MSRPVRRLALLLLVVPFAAGCGWFGGWSPYPSSGMRYSHTATVAPFHTRPADVPRWIQVEHLPAKAVAGARLFVSSGCTACHTYAGSGSSNLGAPDLTAVGTRHLGVAFEIRHLRCPSCITPGSPMPSFRLLGARKLRELAIFLEASKGTR